MFGSLIGIVSDVAKIAVAPVKMAVGVARVVTEPVADAATEAAKEIEKMSKDLRK